MPAPPDEVPLTPDVVRALLREQHPDLADLPLGRRHQGWDMAMHPLGDDLAVRLPRTAAAVRSITAELRWVPTLASRHDGVVASLVHVERQAPGRGLRLDRERAERL